MSKFQKEWSSHADVHLYDRRIVHRYLGYERSNSDKIVTINVKILHENLDFAFYRSYTYQNTKNKRKEAGRMTTIMNTTIKLNTVDGRMEIQQTFCLSL